MIGTAPLYFAGATVAELRDARHRAVSGRSGSVWRRRRARSARAAVRTR